MKIFVALITMLLWWSLPSALCGELPTPVVSPNQLFYIQRSKDANTVIYEANLTTSQQLNPSKPVAVYWIRYAERSQREDLTHLQWQMAFGYRHKPAAESGAYDISLNAFRQWPLRITYHSGKLVAMTLIMGRRACLQKVFVQLDSKTHLIPRVQFVELFGTDVATSQPVYERIIPN